jgi:hypothetical protein
MNLEQELSVGHNMCSCSFCKINKINKQSIRRFVFGRTEFNLLRGLRGLEQKKLKLRTIAISARTKKMEKEANELPDLIELEKTLKKIIC